MRPFLAAMMLCATISAAAVAISPYTGQGPVGQGLDPTPILADSYRRGMAGEGIEIDVAAIEDWHIPAGTKVTVELPRPNPMAGVRHVLSPQSERPVAEISEARRYLVETARPGFTMSVIGPRAAVDKLHPVFVLRAAAAIKEARAAGLERAGLFSCYRPPILNVGGFADKFNSLHAYGLAGDFTGIGSVGSSESKRWYAIATKHGLYNPYGYKSRAEFNHYQVTRVTIVRRGTGLRTTIAATGAKDVERMWRVGTAIIDEAPPQRGRHSKRLRHIRIAAQ